MGQELSDKLKDIVETTRQRLQQYEIAVDAFSDFILEQLYETRIIFPKSGKRYQNYEEVREKREEYLWLSEVIGCITDAISTSLNLSCRVGLRHDYYNLKEDSPEKTNLRSNAMEDVADYAALHKYVRVSFHTKYGGRQQQESFSHSIQLSVDQAETDIRDFTVKFLELPSYLNGEKVDEFRISYLVGNLRQSLEETSFLKITKSPTVHEDRPIPEGRTGSQYSYTSLINGISTLTDTLIK